MVFCVLGIACLYHYVFCDNKRIWKKKKIQKFELSNLVMFAHNALSCIKDHWLPECIVIDLLLTAMLFYGVLLLLQVSS